MCDHIVTPLPQTQYLSVTLPEIMSYMKSPALYVWDCNRAGTQSIKSILNFVI